MKSLKNLIKQILLLFDYKIKRLTNKSYVNISKSTVIRKTNIIGNVSINEGCKIIGGVTLETASSINIGRYTSINGPNTDLVSKINSINVGSFCSIARNVSIQEFNHRYDRLSTYYIFKNILREDSKGESVSKGNIEIGNDVWIGAHCVILSGAIIGNGAIIAANSVVNNFVPPYAIAGGSPAKIIKYRFDTKVIDFLEQLKWWEWPIEKIKSNKELFEIDINNENLCRFKL